MPEISTGCLLSAMFVDVIRASIHDRDKSTIREIAGCLLSAMFVDVIRASIHDRDNRDVLPSLLLFRQQAGRVFSSFDGSWTKGNRQGGVVRKSGQHLSGGKGSNQDLLMMSALSGYQEHLVSQGDLLARES